MKKRGSGDSLRQFPIYKTSYFSIQNRALLKIDFLVGRLYRDHFKLLIRSGAASREGHWEYELLVYDQS